MHNLYKLIVSKQKIIVGLTPVLVLLAVVVLNFSMASAVFGLTAQEAAIKGLDSSAVQAGFQKTTEPDPAGLIGKVVQVLLGILGIVFLVIVVYGGMTWMLAAGKPEEFKRARSMIIEGAIGLAICLGAYALTYYIVGKISGAVGIPES